MENKDENTDSEFQKKIRPVTKRSKSTLKFDGIEKYLKPSKLRSKNKAPPKIKEVDLEQESAVKRVNLNFRILAKAFLQNGGALAPKELSALIGVSQSQMYSYVSGKSDSGIWSAYNRFRRIAAGMGFTPSKFVAYLEGEINEEGLNTDLVGRTLRFLDVIPQQNLGTLVSLMRTPKEKLGILMWFLGFLAKIEIKTLCNMKSTLESPNDGFDILTQLISIKTALERGTPGHER